MSAQHTSGPWQRDIKGRTISSAKGAICECFSGPVGVEECDANERLIAAAPDLLAALQELLAVNAEPAEMSLAIAGDSEAFERFLAECEKKVEAAKVKARAAIAKATGEQA